MREIKFRAWDIENKKMMYPKDGYFVRDSGTRFMVSADGKCVPVYLEESVIVKPILEQYTGLKDRNGVEIYEGDICEANRIMYDESEKTKGTVEFKKGQFIYLDVPLYIVQESIAQFNIKIIGNIHQNKDQ